MTTAGFLYALCAAVLWGVLYVVSEKVLQTVSPLAFLFMGYALSGLAAIPFIFFRWDAVRQVLLDTRPLWGWIIVVEIIFFIANLLILSSIRELGSPLASAIEISYPFFVAVFAFLVFGTAVNLYFWAGAGLVFAGAAVITLFA